MNIPNNSENSEQNNIENSINFSDNRNNSYLGNDDGSIIDDNNIIEDECITPKDDEENVNSRKKKKNDKLNKNENKNLRIGRNESRNETNYHLQNGHNSNILSNAINNAINNVIHSAINNRNNLNNNVTNTISNNNNNSNISYNMFSLDNIFVNEPNNFFLQDGVHAESNNADEQEDDEIEEHQGNDAIENVNEEEEEEDDDEEENEVDEIEDEIEEIDEYEERDAEEFQDVSEEKKESVKVGQQQNKKIKKKKKKNENEDHILCNNDNDCNESVLLNNDIISMSNEKSFSHINTLNSGKVDNLTLYLQKELTCPICLDYFYLPVTMNCGHTFCRYCIGHNKLNGKNCPLCRQPLGHTSCINTIISNLVRIYNLRRKSLKIYKSIEIVNTVDEIWWNENFIKPQVSVSLFLRIFLHDMISPPIFFDDLTACIIDFFTVNNLWSKAKWVFNIKDCRVFSELIGYDKDDKETTSERLHAWVERYITQNPSMCMRKEEKIILKLYQDRTHRIDSHIFDSSVLPNRLPWDGGRHAKSLIHMPHSSVSLSHLLFVKAENNTIGVVDCGSTIGTMIKVNNYHILKEGDVIHIGDRLEVTVSIEKNTAGMPYKGYVWNKNANKVLDRHELNELIKFETNSNQDIYLTEDQIPSYCENIESNLLIKFDFGTTKEEITPKTEYIDPKGVVLGRGPYAQSSYKKISVTNSNGYVSREHCLIYYDGSKLEGERWLLRDTSTLGTFLKIKSYSNPVPLPIGSIFKAGQCKIEVCSHDTAQYIQYPERSLSLHNTNNASNLDNNNNNNFNNNSDNRNNDNDSNNTSNNNNNYSSNNSNYNNHSNNDQNNYNNEQNNNNNNNGNDNTNFNVGHFNNQDSLQNSDQNRSRQELLDNNCQERNMQSLLQNNVNSVIHENNVVLSYRNENRISNNYYNQSHGDTYFYNYLRNSINHNSNNNNNNNNNNNSNINNNNNNFNNCNNTINSSNGIRENDETNYNSSNYSFNGSNYDNIFNNNINSNYNENIYNNNIENNHVNISYNNNSNNSSSSSNKHDYINDSNSNGKNSYINNNDSNLFYKYYIDYNNYKYENNNFFLNNHQVTIDEYIPFSRNTDSKLFFNINNSGENKNFKVNIGTILNKVKPITDNRNGTTNESNENANTKNVYLINFKKIEKHKINEVILYKNINKNNIEKKSTKYAFKKYNNNNNNKTEIFPKKKRNHSETFLYMNQMNNKTESNKNINSTCHSIYNDMKSLKLIYNYINNLHINNKKKSTNDNNLIDNNKNLKVLTKSNVNIKKFDSLNIYSDAQLLDSTYSKLRQNVIVDNTKNKNILANEHNKTNQNSLFHSVKMN
ncbi:zinc finger protein, putative [Plasmodium gallinaceum]|uniref:E3 ubiquitin-protein ligase CHFR n=1 Tax=Plasmodium gallinaceum TaxID=5849 RepID=A0A1J1GY69_PLAGA|nr:zinc finger protein, putative [Plasmodium gallinaceum]CRG95952.1 zinc finger protein, putative [Plasmodium gallinaceum]